MAGMDVAASLSEALAGTVKAMGAAVVRVEGRDRRPSSGVAWTAGGTIVTAAHTVERDEGIEVALADGQSVAARLVGRDPGTDVAVLEVAAELSPPAWGELDGVEVGHLVLGIARPGRTARALVGIVSALGEAWRTPAGGRVDRYLEADLELRRGFSGGLLASASGRALGMSTSGLLRGSALAVPAATLRRVVEAVTAHGRVRRAYLGLGTYPVRLPPALEKESGQRSGLIVVSVQPESPAERAGLQLGDVMLSFDGARVAELGDLLELLDEERVGKEAVARVVRGGRIEDVRVTVGARP